MSIEQKSLSPMWEILKKEWNNGWKTKCEKEMKKISFIKAFHHSAKDHVRFWWVHEDFKKLVNEFVDLWVSRKFTTRILKILDIKCENVHEIELALKNILSETSQQVEAIISKPVENKTSLNKDDLIQLWNEKWLANKVMEESKIIGIRKAFLKVFKEYLELHLPNAPLTKDLYIWVESNLSAFFKRLQNILKTSWVWYEEIITTLYEGKEGNVNDFLTFKSRSISFAKK